MTRGRVAVPSVDEVAEQLRERLAAGAFREGVLPCLDTLRLHHQCSQRTMRGAVQKLATEGRLGYVPGGARMTARFKILRRE